MNNPKCRRAVVAGVQSRSPALACKYVFKSWHTEPWCSYLLLLSSQRWDGRGNLILPTLHMVSNISFCKGSPEIKWNLCRARSALNLKRTIWSCQLLLSLERQRRHCAPSSSIVCFIGPRFISPRCKVKICQELQHDELMADVLLGLLFFSPHGAFLLKGWALLSALKLWVKRAERKQLLHPLTNSESKRLIRKWKQQHTRWKDVANLLLSHFYCSRIGKFTDFLKSLVLQPRQQEMEMPIPLPLSSLLIPGWYIITQFLLVVLKCLSLLKEVYVRVTLQSAVAQCPVHAVVH